MKLASTLVLVVPAILVAFTTSAGEGPKQAPLGWPTLAPGEVQFYYPPSCYLGNCDFEGWWGDCAAKQEADIFKCNGKCDDAPDCPAGAEVCTCLGSASANDAYQSAKSRGLSGKDRVEISNCRGEDDWMSFENLERVVLRQNLAVHPFARSQVDHSARVSGKPAGRAVDRANPVRNAVPRGTSGRREADSTR